jgi:putative two-component system response regulator
VLEDKWALVVEDDAHSLVALSSILRDLGIHFKRNTTGANVLSQLRSMTPLPDFILMDIDLSGGDAFAILRQIRTSGETTGIPVIVFGEAQEFAVRQRAQSAGFSAYLPKPLPRRQFGSLLTRILNGENVWQAVL